MAAAQMVVGWIGCPGPARRLAPPNQDPAAAGCAAFGLGAQCAVNKRLLQPPRHRRGRSGPGQTKRKGPMIGDRLRRNEPDQKGEKVRRRKLGFAGRLAVPQLAFHRRIADPGRSYGGGSRGAELVGASDHYALANRTRGHGSHGFDVDGLTLADHQAAVDQPAEIGVRARAVPGTRMPGRARPRTSRCTPTGSA